MNVRVAVTLTEAPGASICAADAGAKSSNGPPVCVPPGGRAATTMLWIATLAVPWFVYVTVPVTVSPGCTVVSLNDRAEVIVRAPLCTEASSGAPASVPALPSPPPPMPESSLSPTTLPSVVVAGAVPFPPESLPREAMPPFDPPQPPTRRWTTTNAGTSAAKAPSLNPPTVVALTIPKRSFSAT